MTASTTNAKRWRKTTIPSHPAGFARRAIERLRNKVGDVPEPVAVVAGDHVLNPGFVLGTGHFRDAAVLIPVVAREPAATMLLTQRTAHLSTHAGQIAFPGGKIDPTDASPTDAALREAEEEVGLDRASSPRSEPSTPTSPAPATASSRWWRWSTRPTG